MGQLDRVDADRLRAWLPEVRSAEATAALMIAVAYDRGIGTRELASWYDRSDEWVEETIEALDSPGFVSTVARLEGVDIEAVAAESNLAPETVRDWFDDLDDEPVDEA
ncbi:molecular chaperone DnaJ, partial [Halorubrum sp. C3]